MSARNDDILSPGEVEPYVAAIEKSSLMELGTLKWLDMHERYRKLALKSVIQVLSQSEETVKECLITYEKLPIIVHDLILVELWRELIFPKIAQKEMKVAFTIYPILFHESVCLNLLETVLYHSRAADTLGDSVLDLTDYCLRSLNALLAKHMKEDNEDDDDHKSKEGEVDIKEQSEALIWGISVKTITTLRYIIEHLQNLGCGLTSRLAVSSDTPMMLTELILAKPWRRESRKDGKIEDFDPVSNSWKPVHHSARNLINPKTELQAWLALFLMFNDNTILSAYELYDSRKNNLLRLRPCLNEMALEQFPFLSQFSIFLNQLAVTSGPSGPSKSSLLLEMVPPIRAGLEDEFKKNKKKIVDFYTEELLNGSDGVMREKASILANAYDFEQFKAALPVVNNCANPKCNIEALRKCGKCKKAWYCSRECQIDDWKEHRTNCSSD